MISLLVERFQHGEHDHSTTSTMVDAGQRQRCAALARWRTVREVAIFPLTLGVGGLIFSLLEREGYELEERALVDFLRRANASLTNEPALFDELLDRLGRDAQLVQERVQAMEAGTALPYQNPFDWWGGVFFCFTASTTIGYGRFTPLTDSGKLLTVLYSVVAIPVCFRSFAQFARVLLVTILRLLTGRASQDDRLRTAFHIIDKDGSGSLDFAECTKLAALLGYRLDDSPQAAARFAALFKECDDDGNATIDEIEFRAMLEKIGLDGAQRLQESILRVHMTGMAVAAVLLLLGGYTCFFGALHPDFSYVDGLYFAFDTFTTIGFGDLSIGPHPALPCLVFMLLTFVALGVTAVLVTSLIDKNFADDFSSAMRGAAKSDGAAHMRGAMVRAGRALSSRHLVGGSESRSESWMQMGPHSPGPQASSTARIEAPNNPPGPARPALSRVDTTTCTCAAAATSSHTAELEAARQACS